MPATVEGRLKKATEATLVRTTRKHILTLA
jgi:hypothetical protein